MIEPTVGRIVHYRPPYAHEAPLAAIVAGVHTARSVNLLVIHDDGSTFPALEIVLLQDDDSIPDGEPYAEWMAFQKGQVPASSAVEERLATFEQVLKAGGPIHQILSAMQETVEHQRQRLDALEQDNAPKAPEEAPPAPLQGKGLQDAGQQQT